MNLSGVYFRSSFEASLSALSPTAAYSTKSLLSMVFTQQITQQLLSAVMDALKYFASHQ
jgi:hypothetical protein